MEVVYLKEVNVGSSDTLVSDTAELSLVKVIKKKKTFPPTRTSSFKAVEDKQTIIFFGLTGSSSLFMMRWMRVGHSEPLLTITPNSYQNRSYM